MRDDNASGELSGRRRLPHLAWPAAAVESIISHRTPLDSLALGRMEGELAQVVQVSRHSLLQSNSGLTAKAPHRPGRPVALLSVDSSLSSDGPAAATAARPSRARRMDHRRTPSVPPRRERPLLCRVDPRTQALAPLGLAPRPRRRPRTGRPRRGPPRPQGLAPPVARPQRSRGSRGGVRRGARPTRPGRAARRAQARRRGDGAEPARRGQVA